MADDLENEYKKEVEGLTTEINFKDKNFILKNLAIAVTKLEDDRTHILQGRHELVNQIVNQVCFFVFAALRAFLKRPLAPSILVCGDGFVGTSIITALMKFRLASFLKIFSRGIIKAKMWKQKGLNANCSILHLLNGQRPDVVIICTESANFSQLSSLLMSNQILGSSAFVISTTFGVERKKIFGSFGVHNIFRTFCEPTNALGRVKMRLGALHAPAAVGGKAIHDDSDDSEESWEEDDKQFFGALASSTGGNSSSSSSSNDLREDRPHSVPLLKSTDENEELKEEDNFAQLDTEGANNSLQKNKFERSKKLHSVSFSVFDDDNDNDGLSLEESSSLQQSAEILAKRSQSLTHVVHQLENFYVLNGHTFENSRKLAIKVIFGEKAGEVGAHPERNHLRKSFHQTIVPPVPISLASLRMEMDEGDGSKLPNHGDGSAGSGDGSLESVAANYFNKNLNSALESMRDQKLTHFQSVLLRRVRPDALRDLNNGVEVTNWPRSIYFEKKRRAENSKRKINYPLYTDEYIKSLLDADSLYAGYEGPGFAYMSATDGSKKNRSRTTSQSSVE